MVLHFARPREQVGRLAVPPVGSFQLPLTGCNRSPHSRGADEMSKERKGAFVPQHATAVLTTWPADLMPRARSRVL